MFFHMFSYYMHVLTISSESQEMRASQAIFIDHISLEQTSICVDEKMTVTIGLTSNFPKPVSFRSIEVNWSLKI